MESAGIIPIVLTAMGVVAAVLLGVWGIAARYDNRLRDRIDSQSKQLRDRIDSQSKQLRDRIDSQSEQLRDRIDSQGKETTEQLGQLRERMAKLEGLLEGLREAITGKRFA
jgi:gas vesicle protein